MSKTRLFGRLLLAFMWLWASLAKLSDLPSFRASIEAFQTTSPALTVGLSLYVPWLELTLAIALLTPWHRASLLLTVLLVSIFTLALVVAWSRGLDLSCGCFGQTREKTNFPLAIIRNLLILLISVPLLLHRAPKPSP